jgi:hypothetical protein
MQGTKRTENTRSPAVEMPSVRSRLGMAFARCLGHTPDIGPGRLARFPGDTREHGEVSLLCGAYEYGHV